MIWLTTQERVTLAVLGALALVGLGILGWQQRRPPMTVEIGPPPTSPGNGSDVALSASERASYAHWDAQLQASKMVDLNRATIEDLERLPDIGPSTAQRIIDYRQQHGRFRRVEDLLEVQGIGPKTLEGLNDYVTVQ